jgi:O-antigen/teichoic acid export membrane protein
MLRNAAFVTVAQGTGAVLGFVFWVVSARLADASAVGAATTLVSASSMTAYLSVFGINSTFTRFLPTSNDPDAELSSGFIVVFAGALLLSLGYVELLPVVAPKLAFVQRSPLYTIEFVAFSALGALSILTDSVFLARQKMNYIFWSDGIIQGAVKLLAPFALIITGMYATYGTIWIFSSFGLAVSVDVIASLVLITTRLGYNLNLRFRVRALTRTLRYTVTNYAVNVLDILPTLVLPTIVIDGLGSRKAGYFFIAFQVASVLSGVGVSIALSALSEGAQSHSRLDDVTLRSRFLLSVTILPVVLAGLAVAPWVLVIFGTGYQRNASDTLVVLVLAVPAVALCQWARSLLQITKQLRLLLVSQSVYAAVVLGLSIVVVHRGTTWVAGAYLLGNLVAGVIAGTAFLLRNSDDKAAVGSTATVVP